MYYLVKFKNYCLHIILPLLAGVLIYIAFREPITFLHRITGITKTPWHLSYNSFNQFILFHFPDMCWAYALTASLMLIISINKYICAAISILFVSLFELKQAGFRISDLDLMDSGLMAIAVLLAVKFVKK